MDAGEAIRLVLADDHAPTRAGIRLALAGQGFQVCAEASDARGAVEATLAHKPDLVLLDVQMPGNGIAAAADIATQVPDVAIVMLTVSRDDSDLFQALRAGARGYLLKDTDPARLPYALRGVLAGEAALPRGLVARLIDEFRSRGRRLPLLRARGVELTDREWEVLELLYEGMSTAEIAGRLEVSPVTVRRHVSEILKKLRVPSREAAVELLKKTGA